MLSTLHFTMESMKTMDYQDKKSYHKHPTFKSIPPDALISKLPSFLVSSGIWEGICPSTSRRVLRKK